MDFWVQSNLPAVDAEGCPDEITWFPVKSVIKAIDVYNIAVPIFTRFGLVHVQMQMAGFANFE